MDKKWSFSKSSLRKYSGFNRTLIVKNFKFIAQFLDQTGGGKETIKDNLPWFDLFRMLKIQNLYLFKLLWYGTQIHVFYILSTYLAFFINLSCLSVGFWMIQVFFLFEWSQRVYSRLEVELENKN